MITALMCFIQKVSGSNPSSPRVEDPSNLRIKIPKCTYLTCGVCKNTYIKEHDRVCSCRLSNPKD
jgi:hypothetical protein